MIIKKRKSLLLCIQNPRESDINRNLQIIEKRIFNIMSKHIGIENSISSYELFEKVMNTNAEQLNVFERAYLWNVIRAIMSRLRGQEILFVVNSGSNYYILQSKEELKRYHKRVDTSINTLNELKKKASRWVKAQSWRNL
jgi:hypothetical protein